MSSRRCLGHTVCGCHDHTLTELSSRRLQSPWEMSGRFPDGSLGSSLWGHLAVAATGVEESRGQRASPSSFLKCSSAFLLGTVFSVLPHPPAPWHLLRTKPQVLNILSCLNLPSAGFLSLSQHGWLPLAFFFFF